MHHKPVTLGIVLFLSSLLTVALAESFPEREPITAANAAQITEFVTLQVFPSDSYTYVNDVAFSPDGTLFALGLGNYTWELRELDTQEVKTVFDLGLYPYSVESLAYSPDGSIIATADESAGVRLWDAETEEEIRLMEVADGTVFDLAFTPDGTKIVAGDGVYNVWVWDVETGENLARIEGAENLIASVDVSPDSASFAAASWDGNVRVYDFDAMATGSERLTLEHDTNGSAYSVAYSPDGSMIATGGYGKVILWDADSGQQLATLTIDKSPDGYGNVWSLGFSPDGSLLAVGLDYNGPAPIMIWDVAAQQEITRLQGHESTVLNMEFSPGGTLLASASGDGSVRFWGVAAGD
jgi:WD40 repeat protein